MTAVSSILVAVSTACALIALSYLRRERRCAAGRPGADRAPRAVRRRAAELALADVERTQRLILESLKEAVILHSPSAGVVRANRAATEMFGVVEGPVPALVQLRSLAEMFEADGSPFDPTDAPSQRVLRSGERQRARLLELRYRDGSCRWVQVDSQAVCQQVDGDEQTLVLQTFADVTAARTAERALADADEIQRAILDGLDEGVVVQDPELGVIAANLAATEMLDVTVGPEPYGVQLLRNFSCFEVDGTPLDLDDTPTRRALRTGQDQKARLLEYRHRNGGSTWIQADAYPLAPGTAGAGSPVLLTLTNITDAHQAAVRLADSERRQRLVMDNSRDLTTIVDMHGMIQFVSPATLPMLGFRPDDVVDTALDQYLHPDDYAEVAELVMTGADQQTVRVRALHADGTIRWLETLVQRLTTDAGPASAVLLTSRDITGRLETERELEQERQFLDATLASIHAGIMAVRHDGRIIDANAAFCEFGRVAVSSGMHVSEIAPYYELWYYDGEQVAQQNRPLSKALAGEVVTDEPLRLVRHDGTVLDVLISAAPIHTADGQRGGVLTLHDVTALRVAETELRRFATVDTLTGLHNRRAIIEHLQDTLERNRHAPDRVAVLFLDLDGFKSVNDRLGHAAGDELLIATAQRLQSALRIGDWTGRHGGDEFVVILDDSSETNARHLARRIEAKLEQPFLLESGVAQIGCSVGIAVHRPGHTADTILAAADAAMYLSKEQHKASPRRA